MFRLMDDLAHLLYCPTMLGRRIAVARWHHRIHLISGWMLTWVCDRYDLHLGLTSSELHRRSDEFAEFNTTEQDFDRAWTEGEPVDFSEPPMIGYRCSHLEVFATEPGVMMGPPWSSLCNCDMNPVYG